VTLLADLVNTSSRVAETASRSGKIAILAELLRTLAPAEIAIATGVLSGVPRQGRVGVGYSTIYGLSAGSAETASLELTELDAAIVAVQGSAGSGSGLQRKEILRALLDRATDDEAGFIQRLFTGELRQGAQAGLMIDAVAKAAGASPEIARRAFMLSGDLPHTAEIALIGGEDALRAVGFELFRPVLPMLASTAATVAEAVASFAQASVEWKVDGIRIQIHRRGEEVRVYTRNLNDITAALPGIVDVVRALDVEQAVLDCEALWMAEGAPAAFQDTVARIDRDAPPEGVVTFLFDLLHVDGEDLLDVPLAQRLERLEGIAPELTIPGTITSDPEAGQRVLDEALRAGHEGVVVKDATSLYAAGRRG
jgi:DNA ligase-1